MYKFCVVIILATYNVNSYKILAIFPMPSHSHYVLHKAILLELARKGHEVTAINPFPQKIPVANFTDISVESIIKIIEEKKQDFYSWYYLTPPQHSQYFAYFARFLTEVSIRHRNVQKLLRFNKSYDLILMPLFSNEAFMGLQYKFKAPVVLISTLPFSPWWSQFLSFPNVPSYIPSTYSSFKGKMTFWERFLNIYYHLYEIIHYQWVMLPQHREMVRKYIPGSPDLYDFLYNVSLVLVNAHSSITGAVPTSPHIIEIGGLHIEARENKTISEDLKRFLDNSKEGVILFSLGSNLKSVHLPEEKRNAILKAFSKFKQNVIWKWEEDILPDRPPNVKIMKWVPQSTILAHPNTVVFVTHGGLQSMIESLYYAVPIIGIPIFADQKMNIANAVSYGYAEAVSYQELNEEKFSETLRRIIDNPKYRKNAQIRSKILRDKPRKTLDDAIYWIEYVIRHKGAPHLKYAGAHLTWYQRYLLDVTAAAFLMLLITVTFIKIILHKLFEKKFFIKEKVN